MFLRFINFYQLLDSRDDIILRLKERTKYFKYYLKNSLMIIAYYMIVLLLLMGIAINLRGVSSYNLVLYKDYTNKFLPIPLIILKTFFTLLEFNLIEFSLSAKFNNQKISVIISLILEILIASSIDFYNFESILRFINPGFYAFSLGFCSNAYLELLDEKFNVPHRLSTTLTKVEKWVTRYFNENIDFLEQIYKVKMNQNDIVTYAYCNNANRSLKLSGAFFNKKNRTIDEVKFEVLQKAMVMNSEVSMTALTKFKGYYIYYINSCERNVVMIYNDGLSLSQLKKNIDDNKSQLFEYIYMI